MFVGTQPWRSSDFQFLDSGGHAVRFSNFFVGTWPWEVPCPFFAQTSGAMLSNFYLEIFEGVGPGNFLFFYSKQHGDMLSDSPGNFSWRSTLKCFSLSRQRKCCLIISRIFLRDSTLLGGPLENGRSAVRFFLDNFEGIRP